MLEESELVTIGKIERPFGVRGEVKVRSLSDVPGRLQDLREATLVAKNGLTVTAKVLHVRPGGQSFIMRFDAFATPEEASVFRGGDLKVLRATSPRLPDDHYYEHELLGMTVQDEQGRVLGTLDEVWQLPGNPVFVVRAAGRELLVPALKRAVASVDQAGRIMVVRATEGVVEQS
jgi:16S rRNA processing protein RimM